MKYPVFASFIILILVIRHAIRRNRRIGEEAEESFWKREHDANEVRRKPLDDLIYVTPDTSSFPMDVLADDPEIADCRRLVDELKEQKIVNLTGQTNTDLKLRYGVANLPLLTEYDDRYTLLVQTLQKWADRLWETGHTWKRYPFSKSRSVSMRIFLQCTESLQNITRKTDARKRSTI